MYRTSPTSMLLISLLVSLAMSGCISIKIVSVDEKTQLENQILGSFKALQQDLVLISSVRGEGRQDDAISPARREVIQAMMNRQFNLDDVVALKQKGVVGENNEGLLNFFETEQTRNDDEFRSFAVQIKEDENRDRSVIMKRVIAIDENLSQQDYPLVQKMMYKLNVEDTAPGARIQSPGGEWSNKDDYEE